ncbi:MAG: alginate lyase family protein [Acidobacteria bacterium]|nr:alginate lyase family protein [Acidobacteriota bacterium]
MRLNRLSLARLRRLTRAEVSWRARQTARIGIQRLGVRLRRSEWCRGTLPALLADGVLDRALQRRASDADWHAAHVELVQQLRERTARFALDPARRADLGRAILERWPAAGAGAAKQADDLIHGRYDLLGYRGLTCTSAAGVVDWHADPVHKRRAPLAFWADVPYLNPVLGDHKVIWELNRHQHWLRLGRAWWLTDDDRYRRAIVDQLYGWLAANPPLVGINWASMLEIALRAISWTWTLHLLLAADGIPDPGEKPWLIDLLVALDRQLTHVEQNLSVYFSPNTHLTGEALALYVVGVALPELASSSRWAETGRAILLQEIERQIHDDGGHAERSTHYQRYTLDFYLMAFITAMRDGDVEAAAQFRGAASRLAAFTRTIADDDGRLPLIGDDDGGMLWPLTGRACHDVRDSLALAALLLDRSDLAPWGLQEEVFWIAGRRALDPDTSSHLRTVAPSDAPSHSRTVAPSHPLPSRTFPDTGYVVIRDPSGSHAVFDVGRQGFLNGGHAHADALAITLGLAGRPLLVDPGMSTYTVDARVRDRLRSSMSHNTVTLDERSQAIPSGPFHWRTHADAQLAACRHNPAFDWAEAFHDGYTPLRHRRTLLRAGGWLIADEILAGSGPVTASAHWHFDPSWMLREDGPGRLEATHADGTAVWLLYDGGDGSLVHGDEESGLGWFAPVYGTLIPTWAARVTRRAPAPLVLLTWIAEASDSTSHAPRLERLAPAADPGGVAIGARVSDGRRTSVFLLRPGEPPSQEARGGGTSDYQTDARLLHYTDAGRLLVLDLIDASHATALGDGWISVSASEPVPDLHIALADETLDVAASAPPPQLRIQGDGLAAIRRVLLNRREMPLPSTHHRDSVVIYAVDWPADDRRAAAPLPLPGHAPGVPFAALP